jgi:hypothetical protein
MMEEKDHERSLGSVQPRKIGERDPAIRVGLASWVFFLAGRRSWVNSFFRLFSFSLFFLIDLKIPSKATE